MSLRYVKTIWTNDITAVNSTNMNNIENGIETVTNEVNQISPIVSETVQNLETLSQNLDLSMNAFNMHIQERNNPHQVTKGQVGLGNVDNTSDIDKPISTAVETALQAKADLINGKVPVEQLPEAAEGPIIDIGTITDQSASGTFTDEEYELLSSRNDVIIKAYNYYDGYLYFRKTESDNYGGYRNYIIYNCFFYYDYISYNFTGSIVAYLIKIFKGNKSWECTQTKDFKKINPNVQISPYSELLKSLQIGNDPYPYRLPEELKVIQIDDSEITLTDEQYTDLLKYNSIITHFKIPLYKQTENDSEITFIQLPYWVTYTFEENKIRGRQYYKAVVNKTTKKCNIAMVTEEVYANKINLNVSLTGNESSLTSIAINDIKYKLIPFVLNGSGLAIGTGSTATDTSLALGYYATASGSTTEAIGYYASAPGVCSTALGHEALSQASESVAIGCYAKAYIPNVVSFDGNNSGHRRTISLYDTDKIFFRNEENSSNKTSYASYTNGKTLTQILNNLVPSEISYSTIAPNSANTSGNLKFVVLSSEPATKYDGWIYIITGQVN